MMDDRYIMEDFENLSKCPWKSENPETFPEEINYPKGMIGPEERRLLHWLGAEYYSGEGVIVDAGAFLGASAFCLASGLARNQRSHYGSHIIHSYDLFVARDGYVRRFIRKHFRQIEANESYLDIFKYQCGKYLDLIQIHEGDFLQEGWEGIPIEILFIDIAKSPSLNSHLFRYFVTALIPGKGILIQQDYYHAFHPHIHVSMQFLRDYFEVVDERVQYASKLYVLKEQIPTEMLGRVVNYDFALEDRLDLLDAAIADTSEKNRSILEIVKLYEHVQTKDRGRFYSQLSKLDRNYNPYKASDRWTKQMQQVKQAGMKRFANTNTNSV